MGLHFPKTFTVCLFLVLCVFTTGGIPVETLTVLSESGSRKSAIEFPASCTLTVGGHLRTFNGTDVELAVVGGMSFMELCADPQQFHVTLTVTGSYQSHAAKLYVTVKDGTRVVKVTLQQNGHFKYDAHNEGGYDCESMAGVQTVVRNFGESLVIETGFTSLVVKRDLKVTAYMVQNPRSPLCGMCGHVDDMTETCKLSDEHGGLPSFPRPIDPPPPPEAAALVDASHDPAPVSGGNLTVHASDHSSDHASDHAAHDLAAHWSYDRRSHSGPDHWHTVDSNKAACETTRPFSRQSPINIETEAVRIDNEAPVPVYTITDGQTEGTLVNSGHAPVYLPGNASCVLKHVPYSWDDYTFFGLHAHFGPDSHSGSEHLVDGHAYAGEVHFIHFNSRYEGLGEAVKHPDGLVVIGVFLEASDGITGPPINEELAGIFEHLSAITYLGEKTSVWADMSKVLPGADALSSYYTYDGSLTTPGCDEIVRWIVLTEPWGISPSQLSALRLMHSGEHESEPMSLHGNYRPVMPLNDRTIIRREGPTAISVDDPVFLEATFSPEESHALDMAMGLKTDPVPAPPIDHHEKERHRDHEFTFDYDVNSPTGPSHWYEQDPVWSSCDSSRPSARQSPIDIPASLPVVPSNSTLGHTILSGPLNGTLRNNGHAPAFEFSHPYRILKGVPHSDDEYELLQLHLHFGPDDTAGSEHLWEGKTYPGEMHFVHKNRKYPTVGEALQQADGLAVIGVFLQVYRPTPQLLLEGTSDALKDIILHMREIETVGHGVDMSLDPNKLLPASGNWLRYITYPGSLTTPGCFEIVRWIILPDFIWITSEELAEFRSLLTGDLGSEPMGKMGNHRPPQPLNGRSVEMVSPMGI